MHCKITEGFLLHKKYKLNHVAFNDLIELRSIQTTSVRNIKIKKDSTGTMY